MSQFVKEETEKVIKIKCPIILDAAAASDFSDQAKAWMLSPAACFVLDLNGVMTISRDFYKAIIQMKTTLKKDSKALYSINLALPLQRQFVSDGVEQVFAPMKTMDEILVKEKLAPAASSGAGLDVAFVNPFLSATVKTLEVQCKTKVKPLKPYLKKEAVPKIAIAGVLTLISKGYTGSIVLCFSEAVFLKVYENMFEEKHEKISNEVQDAAGELLNIIYGIAKVELNQKGYDFQKALPTVLVAESLNIRQSGNRPALIVPFETETGPFHMEIEFNNAGGTSV